MVQAHRHGDSRFCGATTNVEGQTTVRVNGKLWAVEGDPNTHGEGRLISVVGNTVRIGGKLVIVAVGDNAAGDMAGHIPSSTKPSGHSGDVSAY